MKFKKTQGNMQYWSYHDSSLFTSMKFSLSHVRTRQQPHVIDLQNDNKFVLNYVTFLQNKSTLNYALKIFNLFDERNDFFHHIHCYKKIIDLFSNGYDFLQDRLSFILRIFGW